MQGNIQLQIFDNHKCPPRFTSQCRYVMLAVIVGHQMDLDPERLQKAQDLGPYVALYHAPYFLACPLAASAPYNDLLFIQQIRASGDYC